jgi:hypothetical protein
MPMETYRVDVRNNRENDELIVEVYNSEDVITASERASYTEDMADRDTEESTITMSGEFTADTTVVDVRITDFEDGCEVRVVGDEGELFTERFPGGR